TLLEAEVGAFEDVIPAAVIDVGPDASPLLAAPVTSAPMAPDLKITAPDPPSAAPQNPDVDLPTEPPPLPSRPPTGTPPNEVELELGNLGRILLRFDAADDGLKLDTRADDPKTAALLQARKTELLEAVSSTQGGASDAR